MFSEFPGHIQMLFDLNTFRHFNSGKHFDQHKNEKVLQKFDHADHFLKFHTTQPEGLNIIH